jgi:hypothetical protein
VFREQPQVFPDRHARGRVHRADLVQGERKVAEALGEFVDVPRRPGRAPTAQELDALRAREGADLDRGARCGPGRVARGDDRVAARRGYQRGEVRRVVGVVVDQQPAQCAGLEGVQRGACRLPDVVGRRQGEPLAQLRQCPRRLRGLLGRHPPHDVVVGRPAVRVFDRELGLADAAEAVQHQWDAAAHGQVLADGGKQLLAAGEPACPAR